MSAQRGGEIYATLIPISGDRVVCRCIGFLCLGWLDWKVACRFSCPSSDENTDLALTNFRNLMILSSGVKIVSSQRKCDDNLKKSQQRSAVKASGNCKILRGHWGAWTQPFILTSDIQLFHYLLAHSFVNVHAHTRNDVLPPMKLAVAKNSGAMS